VKLLQTAPSAAETSADLAPAADLQLMVSPADDLIARAHDLRRRDEQTAELLREALDELVILPSLSRLDRCAKRVLDVLGSAVLLLVALPLLVVAAVAVKLDSRGPVLFAQERVGLGGRTFRIVKFRSMVVDNDDTEHAAYVARLITGQATAHDGVFKLVKDARVTRVGRFIRRYSIDELPQLWNVLRGNMSLVGPRPALPREVVLYDATARQRLRVKPGVTGIWQVSGRCELSFAEMVELDVAYGRNWALTTDLAILLKTPAAAFTGRGAA
jgi:lipopolysaccharide/colanic/teichoic acid biosynthesis glycosyltransferase